MRSRDDILKLLQQNRDAMYRLGVKSLRLFGSMARDEANEASDIDFLVVFNSTPTFSGYMKLRIFLEDLLGVSVDLMTESSLKKKVRPLVERDAIRVA